MLLVVEQSLVVHYPALPSTVALLAGATFTGNVSTGPYSVTCGALICGNITPTANITFASGNNYTFCGATPTQIGYLNGVTSAVQTQINNLAPKASPTFTGTVTVPGLTSTGNLACGTNSVTCGTLTCTTGTLGGNTTATTV